MDNQKLSLTINQTCITFELVFLQVCRGWNQAFHMPELWRCFEFELNQPASSYLKATHPDLIKQIIKRHSNHLQYVSFKVWISHEAQQLVNVMMRKSKWVIMIMFSSHRTGLVLISVSVLFRWTAAESLQRQRATSSLSSLIVLWKHWGSSPQPGPVSWNCPRWPATS